MQYRISELAHMSGISTRTLRHYDELGILIPVRLKNSNYRVYLDDHVNKLQHILILKALGMDLHSIKKMIDHLDESNKVSILESHLMQLKEKRHQMDKIIHNVYTTISAIKGEIAMKDQDKFEGLKEKLVVENDAKYKDEVIQRFGHDVYDKSRKAFKNFTEEQFNHLNQLAKDVIENLKKCQQDMYNLEAKKHVFELHKAWLTMSWGGVYHPEAHYHLVDMYVEDERFKKYYDQHGEGLAVILRDIVQEHIINDDESINEIKNSRSQI